MSPLDLLTVLGVGSIPAAVIYGLFNRRKTSAEAVQLITGAAASLVTPLQSEVSRLQRELHETAEQHRREVAELHRKIRDTETEVERVRDNCESTMATMRRMVDDGRVEVDRLRALLNQDKGAN